MQHCVSIVETGLDEAIEASRKAVSMGADMIVTLVSVAKHSVRKTLQK